MLEFILKPFTNLATSLDPFPFHPRPSCLSPQTAPPCAHSPVTLSPTPFHPNSSPFMQGFIRRGAFRMAQREPPKSRPKVPP